MNDRLIEERRDAMVLSTNRARLDRDAVLAMLHDAHWGGGVTRDILDRAIPSSLCAGVYDGDRQLTRDARALYERFGFTTDPPRSTYMELRRQR